MINGNMPASRFGVSRTYTKFIVGFIILAIILVFIIFYFSFSQALIKIVPKTTTVLTDFIADIETSSDQVSSGALQGILYETEVSLEKTYDATGSKDADGDVIGTVMLYNKRDTAQPLIATTRLLSDNDVLLRLKTREDIPAGGSVEAEVYADDPSEFETLSATNFTIIALPESLQKLVYAQSKSTLSSKPGSLKVVKAVDIARAREDLNDEIFSKAIENFKKELTSDYVAVVVAKKVMSEDISAEVDQVTNDFTVSSNIKVTIMGIKQQDIVDLSVERLTQLISEDMELSNIDLDNLTYVVQNFDEEENTANIKIHSQGGALLKEDSQIIDKSKLSGLSSRGVQLYLESYDEIESVNVELSPFWVKTVPKMTDNIIIEIEKGNDLTSQ